MDPETIKRTKAEIIAKYGEWTAHNIHAGHGIYTRGERVYGDELKVRRAVQLITDLSQLPWNELRILDLGCNEGLYAIEFAQRGASVVGIEGREANITKAEFARNALGLSNLTFVQSDVRELSVSNIGTFDVVLCWGLLYHLDTPDVFDLAECMRQVCRWLTIVDTQISLSTHECQAYDKASFWADPDLLGPLESRSYRGKTYWGRSVLEHNPHSSKEERLKSLWASLDNIQSFWLTRSSLVNALTDAGFTTIIEVHLPVSYPPDRVTMVALASAKEEVVVAPLAYRVSSPPLAETQAVQLEISEYSKASISRADPPISLNINGHSSLLLENGQADKAIEILARVEERSVADERTASGVESDAQQVGDRRTHMFAGFSVGGVDWPKPELIGVTEPLVRRQIQRQVAFQEAAITRQRGGNLIRVFFGVASILGEGPGSEIRTILGAHLWQKGEKPVYLHTADERAARLDQCNGLLDRLLAGLAQDRNPAGAPLNFEAIDDYVTGVEQYNSSEPDPRRHVRLLLTQVEFPPRWLIEAPAASTLQAMGRGYTFASLWHRYLLVHIHLLRVMVRRYVTQRPAATPASNPAVMAFEICNEPDYEWIPDEVRIERAANPDAHPLGKYVTELHLPQIPETDVASVEFEIAPWGYQEQDGEWQLPHPPTTPVLDFRWGRKFDWYVKCFAEFQEHMSYALRDEARQGAAPLVVVSGGVTHNNLDYLIRMARVTPNAFAYVDRIGLHPYHWPYHDTWDANFVSAAEKSDWMRASPREFARAYFKRFDFLEEVAALTRDPVRGHGLFGKKLWLTEFGIGTKKLGKHNTPVKEFTRFIRERCEPELPDGLQSVVWEDLWDAFFDQVDADYLRRHNVEAILFYTLREAGLPGFDKHDDDRSNLSITQRDGTPRMAEETFHKFARFMGEVTGQPVEPKGNSNGKTRALHAAPWRYVTLPNEVSSVTTMLSTSERALLYWLARDYYTGAGEIVDGGCFVGGSTLSLARGLIDGGHGTERAHVHVYDLFASDPYMIEHYLKPLGINCANGESFRPVFDANTRSVASLLRVNQGDICQIGWSGEPIEIMFIDISKHWSINDVLLTDFFPFLIPGRSVVIQQDFVFEWCPWLAVTMEYLADYFEYVAFVEYNTTVYLNTRPIPKHVLQVKLWDFPIERKVELMDCAIGRFSGYAKGMLECAKAALVLEGGQAKRALEILASVRECHPEDQIVLRAASGVAAAARQSLA